MINEISKWIKNPEKNYQEGISFYNKYKINNKFDEYFKQTINPPTNDLHFKILIKKIIDIHRLLLTKPIKTNNVNSDLKIKKIIIPEKIISNKNNDKNDFPSLINRPKIITENNKINYKELPDNIKKYYDEARVCFAIITSLHAKIKIEKNINKRKKLINKIIQLDDLKAKDWEYIDFWYNNKDKNKIKNDKINSASKAIIINKQILALKTNISRTKTKIKKLPNNSKNSKWKDKLSQWEIELNKKKKNLKILKKNKLCKIILFRIKKIYLIFLKI